MIFNLSNILLVAAIDIAGMAVAFPIGVGLALVLGVITTYFARPEGNVPMLAIGVASVVIAILLDAMAYRRLASTGKKTPMLGIVISVAAGLLMGWFYSFVAQSMGQIDPVTKTLEAGKLSPYTAIVLFSIGLLVSNFLWNSIMMAKPFTGEPVPFGDYFTKGSPRLHTIGILGGIIWNIGMAFSIIASTKAGPALSYGLGQGATMVGAFWGVFIWREFQGCAKRHESTAVRDVSVLLARAGHPDCIQALDRNTMTPSPSKVVVIGSSNTDMIIQLDHLPRPGETVLGGEFHTAAGGKGANQAVAAARAGGCVTFVARIGQDMFGEQAIAGFEQDGIDVDYVQRDEERRRPAWR